MTQPALRLSGDEQKAFDRLSAMHDEEWPELERLDRWYEGTERARYMHEEIFREAGHRIPEVRIFLSQIAVDALAERLFVQGFKTGDEDLDKDLHRVWAANGMDMGLSQAITDALVMRRSYISVGANENDSNTPIVCPESPLELYVRNDPRTRKPIEARRRWCVYDNTGVLSEEYATLYLPNVTIWLERGRDGWRVEERDDHQVGEVMIAPLVNRPRTSAVMNGDRGARRERIGRSELAGVIPLNHSMNKLATDAMVAAERVAIPLRAIFGAGPDEFKDENGNQITPMKAMQDGLLAIPEPDVKAFQFAAAQLSNFTEMMRAISNEAAAVTGLPPHYLGTPSDNPASAEAIAASESRLATHAELKQLPFGEGVLRAAKLWRRIQTGDWDDQLDTAKVDWRDVRTPTVGARADAAQKLFSSKILPLRKVREELGYSDDEIDAMEVDDEAAAAQSPAAQLAGAMSRTMPVMVPGEPANVGQ